MKKHVPTIFLRLVMISTGAVLLAFSIFLLPNFANELSMEFPRTSFIKYPFLIFTYIALIIFFYILYQIMLLLSNVDKDNFFSKSSNKMLNHIKISGIISTAILYLVGLPISYIVAQLEDAPGIIIIAFAVFSIPLVIAIFSIVIQGLLKKIIDIKDGN